MTLNDFLLKFFLIMAIIIAAVFGITYFTNKQLEIDKAAKEIKLSQEQPMAGQGSNTKSADAAKTNSAGQAIEIPTPKPTVDATTTKDSAYLEKLAKEYTLPHTESGQVKTIAADKSTITIIGNNKDVIAKITITTKIFKDAKQVTISIIKEKDNVAIMGRKKTAEDDEFIADSIYIGVPLADAPSPTKAPNEQ